MCTPSAHGGQEKTLDPLELELRAVMRCHGSARNQIQPSELLSHLSSSYEILFQILWVV